MRGLEVFHASLGWLPDSKTPRLSSAFGRAVLAPCSNFFVLWFVIEDIYVVICSVDRMAGYVKYEKYLDLETSTVIWGIYLLTRSDNQPGTLATCIYMM
jgi:hypothetical protein